MSQNSISAEEIIYESLMYSRYQELPLYRHHSSHSIATIELVTDLYYSELFAHGLFKTWQKCTESLVSFVDSFAKQKTSLHVNEEIQLFTQLELLLSQLRLKVTDTAPHYCLYGKVKMQNCNCETYCIIEAVIALCCCSWSSLRHLAKQSQAPEEGHGLN